MNILPKRKSFFCSFLYKADLNSYTSFFPTEVRPFHLGPVGGVVTSGTMSSCNHQASKNFSRDILTPWLKFYFTKF